MCDTGGRAAAAGIIIIIIIILLTLNTAYPGSIWARDQAAAGWSYWVISCCLQSMKTRVWSMIQSRKLSRVFVRCPARETSECWAVVRGAAGAAQWMIVWTAVVSRNTGTIINNIEAVINVPRPSIISNLHNNLASHNYSASVHPVNTRVREMITQQLWLELQTNHRRSFRNHRE